MGEHLGFKGTFFCHQFFCQSAFAALMLVGPVAGCLGADPTAADRSDAPVTKQPQRMSVTSVAPERADEYPAGTKRITYRSAVDGAEDWALFLPGDRSKNTIVYLHGSFSSADQIFTRKDVREFWLTRIQAGGHPLLSVNLRGTAYMSPAATADLTDLLRYCHDELGCQRFVLLGGSGGASSAMAYAVLHPAKIHGVIAMGMCDILARLDFARKSENPVLQKLATTVFAAYGGTPEEKPDLYQARSVLAHTDRLTMPVILTMGENDQLIPVAETRKIAAAMKGKSNFVYHEIPQGGHDSALWADIDLQTLQIRKAKTITPPSGD
jgi:pimeloyl-ACP methyl ester carboxylesterase